jgi:hypothetical protein
LKEVDEALKNGYPVKLEQAKIKILPDGRVTTFMKLTFRPCSEGTEPSLFALNEEGTKVEPRGRMFNGMLSLHGGDLFYQWDWRTNEYKLKEADLRGCDYDDTDCEKDVTYSMGGIGYCSQYADTDCPMITSMEPGCAYHVVDSYVEEDK